MTGGSRVCHKCRHPLEAGQTVGRRDACSGCGWDLHCCLNCDFHDLHCHNECREPEAERQVDKTVGNFCDFFRFRSTTGEAPDVATTPGKDARAALAALFKKK